jgi:hypothetical protein
MGPETGYLFEFGRPTHFRPIEPHELTPLSVCMAMLENYDQSYYPLLGGYSAPQKLDRSLRW